MQIKLIAIGKTDRKEYEAIIADFQKRVGFYIKFDFEIVPDIKNNKNLSEEQQKLQEGRLFLQKIQSQDVVVLLDEHGKTFSSVHFANYLQKKMNASTKQLIFLIGGPYGFSEEIYQRANEKISLSEMTFSHQMIRFIFIEQLYRAMTILRHEPYHHQ
jgi:23S rRNA (pseudouridine1915-N3)-methyltransferase